jgi:GT2 family glycosyltransferase
MPNTSDPLEDAPGEGELVTRQPSSPAGDVARLTRELESQRQRLLEAYETVRKQEEDLRRWRESSAGRLASVIHRGTLRLAPPGTRRRRALRVAVRSGVVAARRGGAALHRARSPDGEGRDGRGLPDVQAQYDEWLAIHEPTAAALEAMRGDNQGWPWRPTVSIIMPTYNSQPEWLRPALDSVLAQVYDRWELCIADDASTTPGVRATLEEYATRDSRVKVVYRERNGGIGAASASALSLATGELIAMLDHDDVLRPHALHRVVEHIASRPDTDVVYSDEDLLFEDGRRGGPHFKPDWSPDLLLSVNYICHLLVARRELADRVGGFRTGFDGAQDHDLALRLTEQATQVGHVADVLYSWRRAPGSTAAEPTAKSYAYDAGRRAVEDALARRHVDASVAPGDQLGAYHVRRRLTEHPQVAILVPTRDRLAMLRTCIASIENVSTYRNWTITVVDNGSVEQETLDYLAGIPHRVVPAPGAFNYSALMNIGRAHAEAPHILMLNNDITVVTPDWIEALLEQALRDEVGVVGGRLVYPDGRTQHEGIGVGNVGSAATAVNLDAGWMGRVVRDVSAVTGACQMVRASVYDQVGGYDETLPVAYNDVDFCLRVRATGRLVVYTPHAELCHRESASRGRFHPAADEERFYERWAEGGALRDPYISPHLRWLNPLEIRVGPVATDRFATGGGAQPGATA